MICYGEDKNKEISALSLVCVICLGKLVVDCVFYSKLGEDVGAVIGDRFIGWGGIIVYD